MKRQIIMGPNGHPGDRLPPPGHLGALEWLEQDDFGSNRPAVESPRVRASFEGRLKEAAASGRGVFVAAKSASS